MRTVLLRTGLALYVVWLAAVVVHAGSWLGVAPRIDAVHGTVVAGAAVAAVVGGLRIGRRFCAVVADRVQRARG